MKRFILFMFVVFFSIIFSGVGWATTHTVNNDSEMDTAVAALNDGDTVIINSSWTADAMYTITAPNIEMYGSSQSNTITKGFNGYLIVFQSNGNNIHDFTLDGDSGSYTASGLGLDGDNNTVEDMIIEDMEDAGIVIYSGETGNMIRGCTIRDAPGTETDDRGVFVNQADSNTVTQCTISNVYTGIFDNVGNSNTYTNNTISNIKRDAIGSENGGTPGDSDDLTITDNVITDWAQSSTGDGVRLEATNSLVQSNTFNQNTDGSIAWAIEVTGGSAACDGSIIEENLTGGAHLDKGVGGGGSNITVRRNMFKAAQAFDQENCHQSVFSYNLMISTGTIAAGVEIVADSVGAKIVSFYHNDVYDAGTVTTGIYFAENSGTWSSITYKNNIVSGFTNGVGVDDNEGDNITHTNNSYYDNVNNLRKDMDGTPGDIALDGSEITTDPLFTAPGSDNFTLQPGSPAIDAGVDLGTSYDDCLDPDTLPSGGMHGWPDDVVTVLQGDYGTGWEIGAYAYIPERFKIGPILGPRM
jgi:hypothetical protein